MEESLKQKITFGNFDGDYICYAGVTHYRFENCPSEFLNTDLNVHCKVAMAFSKMQKAANLDGVDLEIVSGFRSIEYQKTIFPRKFKDKLNPKDDEFISRIRESAPPGFSEHHTGLAIDINSTEDDFKDTEAYNWLTNHAYEFGFENSFPENNNQGLIFEPWHWRYIGDEESKKIFEKAR